MRAARRYVSGRVDRARQTPPSERSGHKFFWCRRRDLNPRPTHYECVALPLSYCGTIQCFQLLTRWLWKLQASLSTPMAREPLQTLVDSDPNRGELAWHGTPIIEVHAEGRARRLRRNQPERIEQPSASMSSRGASRRAQTPVSATCG